MLTALTPHPARRRAFSLGLAALVTVTLAGCGVPFIPYQPFGDSNAFYFFGDETETYGGYTETELADDQYAVCFQGSGHSSQEIQIAADEDMARLRAAEVTLERNYTHFVIESNKTSIMSVGYDCDDSGCYYEDTPLVTLHIKLLKSPDSSVTGALDAKSIDDSLALKYKKPLFSSYNAANPGYKCGER